MRSVDTVGTSCAIVAHTDESAMKNRWNQWNEEPSPFSYHSPLRFFR